MARPKKNGVFDYKEKNGKYSYYVKVVYISDIEGNRKRRPIRARTLGELKEKVAQALEKSVADNENANDSKALEESVSENEISFTLGQWCDCWLQKILPGTVKGSTLSYYTYMLRYLDDDIRSTMLSDLTAIDLQSFFLMLKEHGAKRTGKELSTTTVRSVRATLISALDSAMDNGLLTQNVVKKTKPLAQNDKKEISYLTRDEMYRLMAVAESGEYYTTLEKVKKRIKETENKANKSDKEIKIWKRDLGVMYLIRQWYFVICLACATGMRRGEIFGLTWGCEDYVNNTINIRHNLQGGKLVSPKTRSSARTISLDKDNMQLLRSWHDYQLRYSAAVGDWFFNEHGLIYTNSFGQPVDYTNFRCRYFDVMVSAAGLPKSITFHSLRHTHATQLLASGVDAKTVSKRLGHSSNGVAFTMKTYAHVLEEMDRKAADTIGAIFAARKKEKPEA